MAVTDLQAGRLDADFVARVRAEICKACPAIQNESAGTTNHASRIALVGRIIKNLDGYTQQFAAYVAVDGTIMAQASLTAATDAQIGTALSALIDMFALQNA